MKAVFDTNILIDYLKGIKVAEKEINKFDERYISIITYIEVLVGINDAELLSETKTFLNLFDIVTVGHKISEFAIKAHKEYRFKLPDALIFATAESLDAVFVTRNTKDFSTSIPIIRIPYQI